MFGVTWRHILSTPPDTHNNLLPLLLGNTLPFFDDLCKRSSRFILECIQSESSLSRSVARFGIMAGLGNSFNVRNVVFLCSHFGWQFNEFVEGKISLQNARFVSHFYDQVADSDWCAAELLLDIMNIRECSSVLQFSDGGTFSVSELTCVMMCVAMNHSI